jgi:peptidoglycan/xylan/chitin deacetylase (PgdA/CDA1 family)
VSGALAITVDVDGEAGLPGGGRDYGHRLSSRTERTYGLLRGLPRILAVLREFAAPATFYVPGVTALRHPDEIRSVLEQGHEIGHHGHTHRRPDTLSAAQQRAEIEDGLAALAGPGAAASGYRAPGWELTDTTLALLAEHGFRFDSSLMGDDRPYLLPSGVVELPVHWSLDDAPYFIAGADPGAIERVWRRELELAAAEARALTLTLHPEILGRPHRVDVLRRVLDDARRLGMRGVTHAELAASVE